MPPSSSASSAMHQVVHPADAVLSAINSNPYFIGMMMLLLNLGGRFISLEVTKSQEQFFQNVWVRRLLIFTVLFMGTRNVAVAFWMAIVIILFLGYLLNENSSLCIYSGSSKCTTPNSEGDAMASVTQTPMVGQMPLPTQNIHGLSPEESQIYQTLHAKQARLAAAAPSEKKTKESGDSVAQTYLQNMFMLRSTEGFHNVRF